MSVDRDAISRKITLGFYPVTNVDSAAVFVGVRSARCASRRYDPAARRSAARRRRLAARRRRNAPARRRAAAVSPTSSFPRAATGVRVAATVAAALRERGIDVTIKAVSNAQLFLPRTGVLASGNFDLAYVPWTMGADPDDSAVLACGGAVELHALVRSARRSPRARGARGDRTARAASAFTGDRTNRRRSGAGALPLQRRLHLRVSHAAAAASRPTRSCRRGTRFHGGCAQFDERATERRSQEFGPVAFERSFRNERALAGSDS